MSEQTRCQICQFVSSIFFLPLSHFWHKLRNDHDTPSSREYFNKLNSV